MIPRARPSTMIELDHLVARVAPHGAGGDLPLEGLVGADQQLLAGLAAGVERARDLDAAERAVVEQAAVLAGERHALGDALVDDVGADLGQAVDVGLARAVVAALDGVVEEPVDGVAVALVVLGGVDAALGRDRVGAARGVLVAERLHDVPGLAERRRRARPGQTGADHDHRQAAAVGGVGDPGLELPGVPALLDGAARGFGVDERVAGRVVAGRVVGELRRRHQGLGRRRRGVRHVGHVCPMGPYLSMTPASTNTGTSEKPTVMIERERERELAGHPARPCVAGPAEGLRGAPDAVVQVGAEHQHRHQVDHRQPPGRERVDEQVVRVVRRAAVDVHLADREVQQVPDDEQQQRDAAPPHQPRRLGRSGVLLHRVRRGARRARPSPQRDRGVDVHHEREEQPDPDQPEETRVGQHRLAEGAQVLGVLVVGVVAGEGLQVAVHVQQHEGDEDHAADGHQDLQGDGGAHAAGPPDEGAGSRGGHESTRYRLRRLAFDRWACEKYQVRWSAWIRARRVRRLPDLRASPVASRSSEGAAHERRARRSGSRALPSCGVGAAAGSPRARRASPRPTGPRSPAQGPSGSVSERA